MCLVGSHRPVLSCSLFICELWKACHLTVSWAISMLLRLLIPVCFLNPSLISYSSLMSHDLSLIWYRCVSKHVWNLSKTCRPRKSPRPWNESRFLVSYVTVCGLFKLIWMWSRKGLCSVLQLRMPFKSVVHVLSSTAEWGSAYYLTANYTDSAREHK